MCFNGKLHGQLVDYILGITVHDEAYGILGRYATLLAIEKLFFTNNKTTGIGVGEARGVTLLAAAQAGLPIYEYTPNEIKLAVTGYGRAEKKQVMEMTRMMLKLEKIPKPDDAADALAIALCHAQAAGSLLHGLK